MKLYIQIKDGQPFQHPILGDNFRQAFPAVDTDNLPPEFSRFVRVEPPLLGVYEMCETTYERSGTFYTDVHRVREMTPEEKAAKQQATKDAWAKGPNFASWTFDETICSYLSPVPYPNDDKMYRWDESTTSWVEVA
jgi:hypothetical protein